MRPAARATVAALLICVLCSAHAIQVNQRISRDHRWGYQLSGAAAAASAVARNNTTLAQDGSSAVLLADAWNIADSWHYAPAAEEMPILEKDQRLVVRLSAPADAITMHATLVFEEIGEVAG